MLTSIIKASYRALLPESFRARLRAFQGRIETVWAPSRSIKALWLYHQFRQDLKNYQALPGTERISPVDLWPCLFDNTATSPIAAHYFYQAAWAARRILLNRPQVHLDIGSQLDLIAVLSASMPLVFLDIRPLKAALDNFQAVCGSIEALPFASGSISSLSCLHVIEHIGLGRYGDPLDLRGTEKAGRELSRILAVGGNLYLSAPVGRERTCFNAHRVHSPKTILRYFNDLTLMEFSCEDDSGKFRENLDPSEVENAGYTCGLFWFTKKDENQKPPEV